MTCDRCKGATALLVHDPSANRRLCLHCSWDVDKQRADFERSMANIERRLAASEVAR